MSLDAEKNCVKQIKTFNHMTLKSDQEPEALHNAIMLFLKVPNFLHITSFLKESENVCSKIQSL